MRSLMGLTRRAKARCIFGKATTAGRLTASPRSAWAMSRRGGEIFPSLTVEENLKVPLERPGPWTIARIYELFPRLAERKFNKGRQLSGGEQEMLVSRARCYSIQADAAR